jgi:hypothetical protein
MKGIICGVIGFAISYFFIFPKDFLSLKLVDMTVGDILWIIGGVVIPIIGLVIGHAIDIDSERET